MTVAEYLTDEDRQALLTPCDCGHTINDHGSLIACWRCEDEGGDCSTPFEALLAARLEGIVARGAERALREAADECVDVAFAFNEDVRDWLRDRADRIGATR